MRLYQKLFNRHPELVSGSQSIANRPRNKFGVTALNILTFDTASRVVKLSNLTQGLFEIGNNVVDMFKTYGNTQ